MQPLSPPTVARADTQATPTDWDRYSFGLGDRVQSSLLLDLGAGELAGWFVVGDQSRHSLLQRHTLQNPDGTPSLGIALPPGRRWQPEPLCLAIASCRTSGP
jgi:hypothetical protein